MTDTTENPGTVNLSTTLNPGSYDTAYGAGQVSQKADAAAPETLDAVLRDEIKKQDEAVKEPEAKPKAEEPAKDEAKPAEKAEKPDADKNPDPEPKQPAKDAAPDKDGKEATGREKPPSEGGRVPEPPARLLPRAPEVWANAPREVKAEFERFEREAEAERETHRESVKFHDELREYDRMAKGNQTSVKAALDRYVGFDRQLKDDFGRGMASIAQDQGKTPQEAVTSLLRAYGVTPQQFAYTVMKSPGVFQNQPQMQRPVQAAQPDPIAHAALKAVEELKQQLASQQLEQSVIAPFAANHPRFQELMPDIEKLLKSDIVPASLNPAERLEVAYDMAERLKPPPHRPATAFADPAAADPSPDAGRKSVRGAPSDGVMPAAEDTLPLEDWMRKELRKLA